jgi:hypothetical protein
MHDIMQFDSTYICGVKASTEFNIFLTSTITGNVKIWTCDGDYICDLNQPNWPDNVLDMAKNFFDSSSPMKRKRPGQGFMDIEEFTESDESSDEIPRPKLDINFSLMT